MLSRPKLSVLLATLCLCPASALAWNDVGHMTTARLAYDELTPKARQRVNEILEQLPHYDRLMQDMPADYKDPAAYAFMRAATWPDQVRSSSHPSRAEHRGVWHYVNYPINTGGKEGPMPADTWDGTSDPENILQALAKCEKDLTDKSLPPDQHAIRLCWIEHLIGDLHQPLHATAFFGPDFPVGDKGGNSFLVRGPQGGTTLHPYWDNLMGLTRNPSAVDRTAEELRRDKSLSRAALAKQLAAASYKDWALESFDAAKSVAYRNAQLPGVNRELLRDNKAAATEPPPLPVGYEDNARTLARQRVALAGYRLADKLNALFAPR